MKHIITLLILFTFNLNYAQKTINASTILKDIKDGKTIEIKNATINGVLDFTYMDEALPNLPKRNKWWNNGGSNTIEKDLNNKIVFINCTFNDDVLAYIPHEDSGYTFIANFEDVATFKDCTFKEKAMFKYSEFDKNTDFSGTKFLRDNTFKYAKFKRTITFENTFFDEVATFKYAEFKNNVSFKNTTFKETAIFKYTKFNNGVSFNNVKFEEDLNIKYTKVDGEFDITNMNVAFTIDSKYANINGHSFSKHLLSSKN